MSHSVDLKELTDMNRVDETWKDIGMKVRSLHRKLYVRTYPYKDKIGLIWLPAAQIGFYKGMAHQRLVKATVCSVGSEVVEAEPGDTILFTRLFFIKHLSIDDGTFTGWIDEVNMIGYAPEDVDLTYIGEMVAVGSDVPVAPLR